MLNKVIKEWLTEYKSLADEEIHSYASIVRNNDELVVSLYILFESRPPVEYLDPVCHQLYEFYRSKEKELQRFALEFVPTLIWLYLTTLSFNDKRSCGGVEAFLLGIYNLDIVNADGNLKVQEFRIPHLGQGSVYHAPLSMSTMSLTESALSRYNNTDDRWKSGPHPQYESINGQNRHAILAHLVGCYYKDISYLSAKSHQAFCKACSRICSTGFNSLQFYGTCSNSTRSSPNPHTSDKCNGLIEDDHPAPRLVLSPALLVEMLSCLYYIMFNNEPESGVQAIEDIHCRASYELYPDVLLVTNAIRNSLKVNPSGQPIEGPMGIKISATNVGPSASLGKAAITNASFRTKKLPDDIPVPENEDGTTGKLPVIDEDTGSEGMSNTPSNQSSKHNFKIPGLHNFGKGGKKDKQRGKDSRKDSDASLKSSPALNGDSISSDNVNIAITRNQASKIVDSIELQPMVKKSVSMHEDVTVSSDIYSSDDDDSSVHSEDKIGFMGHSSSTVTIREKKNNLSNSLTNPDSLNSTDM